MRDRLERIEERYNELNNLLMDPEVTSDIKKLTEISKEHSHLLPVVTLFKEYKDVLNSMSDLKEMMHEDDHEIVEMAKMEYDEIKTSYPRNRRRIKNFINP